VFHPEFNYLFNSYYNTVGAQFPRPRRGLLSRPGVEQVRAYRGYVDEQLDQFLANGDLTPEIAAVIELGMHHEQQHQELMLTDIKHVFAQNPLYPVFRDATWQTFGSVSAPEWFEFDEAIHWIGHEHDGFCYDNELPRHRQFAERYALSGRLVTCQEYLEFIADGGYKRPELWLSEGWNQVCADNWQAPLYWMQRDGQWHHFTLSGLREIDPQRPVCHVSYFEADAYATWASARLPSECEWEAACKGLPCQGNFADELLDADRPLHPGAAFVKTGQLGQMFGDVWEWTSSPYTPYPGYRVAEGALGEYNGKFMCNQYVLRGGSCASSKNHIRPTYRNFFPPDARWQFTGFRLAR
jgi:ergothioneine biosynthesis protein EgtB